jgi:hypothetical protein
LTYNDAVPKDQSKSEGFLSRFITCLFLYSEEFLVFHQNPKLEEWPLSAVRDCLLNILAAALHIAGRSAIHNLRTHHAVATGILLTGAWRKLHNSEYYGPYSSPNIIRVIE